MKKTLFILASFTFFLISCSHKPGDMLVGKWQATKIEVGKKTMDKSKQEMMSMLNGSGLSQTQMDSIMQEGEKAAQAKMDSMANKMTMEFTSDGIATLNSDGNSGSGKFTLSDDSKTLTIDDGGMKENYSVISITDNEFVLDMDGQMTVHMKKQ